MGVQVPPRALNTRKRPVSGRIAYSTSATGGRARGRLRLFVLAATALVIALIAWRVCAAGVSDIGAYIDSVRPVVQKSNELGTQVRSLQGEVSALSREILDKRMSDWEAKAREYEAEALAIKPRAGAEGVAAYLVTALHARAVGFGGFRAAMTSAVEGAGNEQASGALAQAVADFSTGDKVYGYFASDARVKLDERGESKIEVPESVYLRDAGDLARDPAKYVKLIQSQPRLAPIHDLAIVQLSTKPAAAGRAKDIDLLPGSSSFTVQVSISNDGNLPEQNVVVKVRLSSEGNPDPQTGEQKVSVLEPGGKKALTFTGLNPEKGEVRNTLVAEVDPIEGEKNTGNNRKEYIFAMR